MGEINDSAFRCAVNGVLAVRIQPGHRGRVDDDAAAVFLHQWCREASAENDGLQIDLDYQVPSLWRGVGIAGRADADAGVVVQDVQTAELRDRGLQHSARVVEFGNIGFDEDGATAGALDALDGFGAAGFVEIGDHNRG